MSGRRIISVVRKEVREFRRNRFVIVTMGVASVGWMMLPMSTRRMPVTPLIGEVMVV